MCRLIENLLYPNEKTERGLNEARGINVSTVMICDCRLVLGCADHHSIQPRNGINFSIKGQLRVQFMTYKVQDRPHMDGLGTTIVYSAFSCGRMANKVMPKFSSIDYY